MDNYTHTQKKSRDSWKASSRSVVAETPQRETTGILAVPCSIDDALGEKKVSSFEENEKDFSQKRTALLDNKKQVDIFSQKKHLDRISLIEIFEQRGHFRQARLLSECQTKWIYYECVGCGSVGRAKNRCGLRVCPDCASRMKVRLLAKYQKGITRLSNFYKRRLRLVTLTLRNVPDLQAPDFNAISEIKEAFYRLRKRPVLRKKIYGGVYGVEATNKGRGWHVHIHAVISSEFIRDACQEMKKAQNRQEEEKLERENCAHCKSKCLRRLWQEETGSSVVDVRKASTDSIIEVVGYITKPLSTQNAELLVDWWQIMRNRPFLKPFGCFYDMRKLKALLTCPWCGGQKFKVYYGSRVRLFDMRDDVGRSPPLGVDIENFQKVLFVEPGKVVVSVDKRGFEDRVLYLQSNLELLVGTYK
jgi:Zn finger protein HypA/HybF involved in hydrogenase expression